jgi:hypothetical protein
MLGFRIEQSRGIETRRKVPGANAAQESRMRAAIARGERARPDEQ